MSFEQIIKIQEEKAKQDLEMYKTVYEQLQQKILNYARKTDPETGDPVVACYYTIPPFIYGFPLIDIYNSMEYLLAKLNKKGFIAIQRSYDTLYVSWELSKIKAQELREKKKKEVGRSKILLKETEKEFDDDLISALKSSKRKSRMNKNK